MSRNCPNCGSKDIKPDTTGTSVFSHGNINDWICNNCGYTGIMPEGEINEDIEFDYEEKETEYSENHSNISVYLTLIIIILMILTISYSSLYTQ